MFGARFFGTRYFAARYFGHVGGAAPLVTYARNHRYALRARVRRFVVEE